MCGVRVQKWEGEAGGVCSEEQELLHTHFSGPLLKARYIRLFPGLAPEREREDMVKACKRSARSPVYLWYHT